MPLQLNGIFSYFHYRLPTNDEILHSDKAFITPDSNSWNPYSNHFSENEESMLDWQGNMMDVRYRKKAKLIDDEDDDYEITAVNADVYEMTASQVTETCGFNATVNAELASAAQTDVDDLAIMLGEKATISKAAMAIGSVTQSSPSYENEKCNNRDNF